ncbi:MAG: NADH-quinone oxidoreductase subunit N [Acidimicrobiales bacterium]
MLATLVAQAAQLPFDKPTIDFHALAPEIVLVSLLALVILVDVLKLEDGRRFIAPLSGVAMLASIIPLVSLALDGADRTMFGGAYVVDNLALVLKAMFLLSGYVVTLISSNYLAEGDFWESEFYLMMLSSILGMVVMSSSRDLITIFVALELLSIPAYLMATWEKRNLRSNEAGLKYYLMGVFASALMLYGMSLLFGVSGSTLLTDINDAIAGGDSSTPIITLGIVLVIVGFGFKVSAVPFHSWAPDTYEGAPTPVTAFLAVASKAAGFVALINLVFIGFLGRADVVEPMMWVLAAASMTVGNLIALRQTNVVRLLAYSGVAQAGFMLAPFAVVGTNADDALTAVVTYLLIYAGMNLAAFAVVIAVSRKTQSGEISSFGGLFGYAPGLAVAMTVALAALAGIPPLGGWFAKFVVFRALASADSASGYTLAIVVAVNSVIAFYYYALVLKAMWFSDAPDGDTMPIRVPVSLVSALTLTVGVTILFGMFPGLIGHFTGNLQGLLAAVGR